LPGWLNVDLDTPEADLHLDFTKPLPFQSNSITHIFSEHFIEHVTRVEAVIFLKECHRLLSDNGIIRISTPSLRFLVSSYLAEQKSEWGTLWSPNSMCLMMNEGMRSWGHQFLYDAQELAEIFLEAGFKTIIFENYRESADKELCGIESRPFHNELIVEAVKDQNVSPNINYKNLKNSEKLWISKLKSSILKRFNFEEENIGDQSNNIYSHDQELTRRGKYIESLEAHLGQFQSIENDWNARGSHIEDLETLVTDQIQQIKKLGGDWEARGSHIEDLEKIVIDQTQQIKKIGGDWEARGCYIEDLEKLIADREEKIKTIGLDWEARGQQIEGLEKLIADRENKIKKIGDDWSDRGDVIDNLTKTIEAQNSQIHSIENLLSDRNNQIVSLEEEKIELTNKLEFINAELMMFKKSIYGRIINKISHIHSRIKSK